MLVYAVIGKINGDSSLGAVKGIAVVGSPLTGSQFTADIRFVQGNGVVAGLAALVPDFVKVLLFTVIRGGDGIVVEKSNITGAAVMEVGEALQLQVVHQQIQLRTGVHSIDPVTGGIAGAVGTYGVFAKGQTGSGIGIAGDGLDGIPGGGNAFRLRQIDAAAAVENINITCAVHVKLLFV